jgi:pyrimidine-specific ribonucleoside hydrolase
MVHVGEFMKAICLLLAVSAAVAAAAAEAPTPVRVPVIDVTDLYHPPQDAGDNFDLIAAYALPEVDLRAVVLDCTAAFRKPKADHPGLFADSDGPRDPGFIPVTQLNCVFGRSVPCAVGPYTMMKSPRDKMLDVPKFQQQGVELILRVLRDSAAKVEILSFGSARPVAAAYNRDPNLFRKKVRRIHLSAGSSEPGFLEWNVLLDPKAIVCLLSSRLPVALYPCGTKDGAFAYGPHNTFWKLPDLGFIARMDPPLRRYLAYAFSRSSRTDFLRALEEEPPAEVMQTIFSRTHNVWETSPWMIVSGRSLVRTPDGRCRIVPARDVGPDDKVFTNQLEPCRVRVSDSGEFAFEPSRDKTSFSIINRGDPKENERALREALPDWYVSIRP